MNADPSVKPNDVVRTSPGAGTAVAPTTSVAVYTNPDATPTIAGGSPASPTLPGISAPSGAGTPCNVFPFGIPCWIGSQLSTLDASLTAPSFSIGTPAGRGGRS